MIFVHDINCLAKPIPTNYIYLPTIYTYLHMIVLYEKAHNLCLYSFILLGETLIRMLLITEIHLWR